MAYFLALMVHVHLPENGSLKGKRKEILGARTALARRFGASVAEVGHHDLWQRATLAVSLAAASVTDLERTAAGVERYLDSRFPDQVTVERRLVSFADLS